MKNLESFGVQALSSEEIKKVDGGWGLITAPILGLITGYVVNM
ncbi:hypothetical protein [Aquimarina algicola]|nr:hypothetical protein [Aquimarina algicola]